MVQNPLEVGEVLRETEFCWGPKRKKLDTVLLPRAGGWVEIPYFSLRDLCVSSPTRSMKA